MFNSANHLCKELEKRGIEYDCSLHAANGGFESITVKFRDRVYFEDEEGYSYFKVNNPLMFQIIDYIDLDAPDYPR